MGTTTFNGSRITILNLKLMFIIIIRNVIFIIRIFILINAIIIRL